jgi:hypothetical protein
VPVLLSSLIGVPRCDLSGALAFDDASREHLRGWLACVPDPRSRLGRWHPLEFVLALALAVCAYAARPGTTAGEAITERACCCRKPHPCWLEPLYGVKPTFYAIAVGRALVRREHCGMVMDRTAATCVLRCDERVCATATAADEQPVGLGNRIRVVTCVFRSSVGW